jgi:hypothetical protein
MPAVKHPGPPDAGNPHVRWDEGEGASGNLARPSLLYRDLRGLRVVLERKKPFKKAN